MTGEDVLYCRYRKPQSRAAYPLYRRGYPPDERKEGDADECYIFGFVPDWNVHCSTRGIVLYNLSGKEIAATTRTSDGMTFYEVVMIL